MIKYAPDNSTMARPIYIYSYFQTRFKLKYSKYFQCQNVKRLPFLFRITTMHWRYTSYMSMAITSHKKDLFTWYILIMCPLFHLQQCPSVARHPLAEEILAIIPLHFYLPNTSSNTVHSICSPVFVILFTRNPFSIEGLISLDMHIVNL